MKRWSKASAAVLMAVVVLAGGQAANASLAPRHSDEQLVDLSAAIVSGRVSAIASAWDANVDTIYTYVTIDVDQVFKGDITERQIVLKQAGGVAHDLRLDVYGQARFELGEDVVVFASVRPRDGTLYTSAFWQGKWGVEFDRASGRRVAVRNDPSVRSGGEVDRRDLATFSDAIASRGHQDRSARAFAVHPADTPIAGANPFVLLDDPARWDAQPVIVDIQAGAQPGLANSLTLIQNGFAAWNGAGAAFVFQQRSTTAAARCGTTQNTSGFLTIVYNDPCAEISNTDGTLAVAFYWSTSVPTQNVNGTPFRSFVGIAIITNDGTQAQPFMQNSGCFAQVLLHELGHALGLGHTADTMAIMFASVSFSQCSSSFRTINADDIAGVRFIYPVSSGGVTPPATAPANVSVTVNGTSSITVSFSAVSADFFGWQASAASSYRLDFYTSPTGSVLQTLTTSTTSTTIPLPPGISGTFFVSVTGLNNAGAGPTSARVAFTIGGGGGCTAAPATPTGVTGGIVSGTATVSWQPSAGATSYIVQAGPSAGSSAFFNANIGGATSVSAGGLPPGFRAFVRIIGVNACGQSAPTADFVLQ